ncbi:hypothetical protein GcM3_185050 [Golovinomyces cichoracearum]|uniref:Uncharacterized protein n=1 Tax=Golovinomyces cichoracearum TaxID=62708 RepID=A0A420HKB1_9PEZI|nr:hypothetical protein GcM3_185050 [Golovinomyces cichoracearum]
MPESHVIQESVNYKLLHRYTPNNPKLNAEDWNTGSHSSQGQSSPHKSSVAFGPHQKDDREGETILCVSVDQKTCAVS